MTNTNEKVILQSTFPAELSGYRLDQALAAVFPEHSRSRLQNWIKARYVTINGQICDSNKHKIQGNETIMIEATLEIPGPWLAQSIPLNIVYEDDALLIINKSAGLTVHPGAGTVEGTLVNALLHYAPELAILPRAGIVHRLDKDTTGLLVVARTLEAHTQLVAQLQKRLFHREYEAIVQGEFTAGGTIEAPIGRHPQKRLQMAVVDSGRPAVTHYRILERFTGYTHLMVKLETGRTHQIRVHMAHIHHPLLGDPTYGGRLRLPKQCTPELQQALQHFQRQALHARKLGLHHPTTGEYVEWNAPLPDDLQHMLELFRLASH